MNSKLTPSERLNARLAAMKQSSPPVSDPSIDDAAAKYIAMAEGSFSDPIEVIRAKWTRQRPDPFIFSRPVYEFSEYEAFVYKLMMVLAGLGRIGRDQAEILAATATYAAGKAIIKRSAPPLIGHSFPEYDQLQATGEGNYIPKDLSQHAAEINDLIQSCRNSPSEALRNWVARHVGTPNTAKAATDSPLFTSQAGPYTIPLGIQQNGQTLFYSGEASLLTIAPSGKGKTQCHVLPTLATYRGPAIVLDIKGECYQLTADWRRQNVGPVFKFNPADPVNSSRYNPLSFVDSSPDELWESSRFLADLLIVPTNKSDGTWETQGKDLLTLIIAFVVTAGEPQERTMATVLDLISTLGLSEMLDHVREEENGFPAAMRRVAARFAKMSSNAPKQFEGVLGGATLHLQVWEGPKVEKATAASDWQPEDFRHAPYPTLYLCIPPNAVETYAPLLRVIIGQHVRKLMKDHSRSPAPILFLLDELPRLGRMEPIREALEVGRSYGIKLWMIAQYPEQLLQAYQGVGGGMMEACDVRMYMNPSDTTAELITRAFGHSKSIFDKSRKPTLEKTDVLGPAHRDSIFVLAPNELPQILQKRFFSR